MQLFYREKGRPGLPPLILLHGLWGASDNWLPVADYLSDFFHVFLPDWRNHGHSPRHPVHDYETLSADLRQWIRELDLPEKPFIAGHSMGGKALMVFLLHFPEQVAGAAVIDIAPRVYPEEEMHRRLFHFLREHPVLEGATLAEWRSCIREAFPEKELAQLLLKNIFRTEGKGRWKIGPEGLLGNREQLRAWPLTSVSCALPVLFVRGEHSGYITSADTALIREFFPAAVFAVIPEAGHWIHATHARSLAGVLCRFFPPGKTGEPSTKDK